ncbi:MAG: LptF/LptG family permease [Chitinophagales bacterium]
MLNKIDKYIIKSFLGPFFISFVIALIIFLMIFLWKYIEDLVGKGLDWWVILKLLFYASANMVPLSLPIAVLLACIMTYGNMGERFELAAFKSAGISMLKFMRSTVVLGLLVATSAFLFSNYILPSAYLKFVVTLVDITKQKPALNIKPNEFYNEIESYSIIIGGKSEDNITIHDVTIYEELDKSNDNVLIAQSGKMQTSPDNQNLVFTLKNGKQYEELKNQTRNKKTKDHVRMNFDEWEKTLDLSGFQMTHTSEELYSNHYKMLNIQQLQYAIDSLNNFKIKQKSTLEPAMRSRYLLTRDTSASIIAIDTIPSSVKSFAELIPSEYKYAVVKNSLKSVRNMTGSSNQVVQRLKLTETKVKDHRIEWHRKFTLSLACLLFVFVGAPLGSIIRKGGFGLPVLFSIFIFIFFYILNITGEKLADRNVLTPFAGMWLSIFIIFPIGIFLTIKAKNDSPVIDGGWYYDQWSKFKNLVKRKKQ